MIRRSRFVFGAQTWETEIAVRPWIPHDRTLGGVRVAASGVPASFIVRRDRMLELSLRFFEDEWLHCLALVEYGQSAQVITWHPDIEDPDPGVPETLDVYLDRPMAGDQWAPTRMADFPQVMELSLMIRGINNAISWRPFFMEVTPVYVGQMAGGQWAFTDDPNQESGSLAPNSGVFQINDDPNAAGAEQFERVVPTRLLPRRGRIRPRSTE